MYCSEIIPKMILSFIVCGLISWLAMPVFGLPLTMLICGAVGFAIGVIL